MHYLIIITCIVIVKDKCIIFALTYDKLIVIAIIRP